jgi:AcrR family transcriptional regulator
MAIAELIGAGEAGKRERAKAANRAAILDAARRVFAELGYETATVRDIIRGTDLAAGTFYNYFKSKEEVFEALADDGARRFKPLLKAVRERARSFEEYINLAVEEYFRFLVAERQRGSGAPPRPRGPHVRSNTPEMIAVYDEVRLGIEDCIARGLAPRVDAEYLTCACIAIAQEVGDAMMQRQPVDTDAAVRFVSALILSGAYAAGRKE